MTDDNSKVDELEAALDHFDTFISGDGKKPSLRQNWIGLQVFATYGKRLPHTLNDLREHLHIEVNKTTEYVWFPGMVKAYDELAKSSTYFFDHVLTDMMNLGNGLKNFASDAAGQDSIFTLVADIVMIDKDQDSALDILKDLKTSALNNKQAANAIKADLEHYHGLLTQCEPKFKALKKEVDADDRTSQAAIDKINGGAEIAGSLANLRAQRKKSKDDWEYDKNVAATTPTYAWCPAAAITVAVIYTKRAIADLDEVDRIDGLITTANADLKKAIATQSVVTGAQDGLETVIKHTHTAIEKTTAIEKGWQGVVDGLDYISGKVSASLRPDGPEDQKLKAARQVKHYMTKSQSRWTRIKPVIEEMTSNVLVSVMPGKTDIKVLIAKLESEAKT